MRKIDVVAQEKFNGDMSKTLEYLLYEADGEFSPYVDELTQEEARMVMEFLQRDAIKHYGSEEKYYKEFKKQHILSQLDLTEEDVRHSTVNPFKTILLKRLLAILASIFLSVLLYFVGPIIGLTKSAVSIGGAIITGICLLPAAETIIKFLKYRRVKKQIDKEYVPSNN